MENFELTPKVDPTQEFIEIANDFTNPLDVVREAISNAFDANAKQMEILFDVQNIEGESVLVITLRDDGTGMDAENLQNFFDLGNSSRRGNPGAIGEKGHGTKVYLNSSQLIVATVHDGIKLIAIMDQPKKKLYSNQLPKVDVKAESTDLPNGTEITIWGFNNNRREKFNHENIKDYILWFTKVGSIEREFGKDQNKDFSLKFKGVEANELEAIEFGHYFPPNSKSLTKLFDEKLEDAPNFYCKKITKTGHLKNYPEVKFEAVFCIEGTYVKYSYNKMIRRGGYRAPQGGYTIQDRYGLWLCKDYIPVQRKNEWITSKGSEFTKLHAFVNCQNLRLTANRGSVDNTPSELLDELRDAVRGVYDDIVSSSDWQNLTWLEVESVGEKTQKAEKAEFNNRIQRVKKARIAEYVTPTGQKIRLVEPTLESGVYALLVQLEIIDPELFPFTIIDYDTHQGIDVIVKPSGNNNPIGTAALNYIEFKNYLGKNFNHAFEHLHSIVCWDINPNTAKDGDEIIDVQRKKRVLKIIAPEREGGYTKHFLDDERSAKKIEVFVLKKYLEEMRGIRFRPRTEQDTL